MEDFADVDAMFGLTARHDEISPIERLLNEFEAHEAKEDRALEFYKNYCTYAEPAYSVPDAADRLR